MANTQTAGNGYKCQWCAVQLPSGTTTCPTCGSPGIPDPDMALPEAEPETASGIEVEQKSDEELIEFWKDEQPGNAGSSRSSTEPESNEQAIILLALVGAVIVSVVMGVLAAPPLLSPVMENITGVAVDNPGDLRPVGGVIGFLFGLFIATIGLWVSNPLK